MPDSLSDRFKHAWNAFMNRDPPAERNPYADYTTMSYYRPDVVHSRVGTERSILESVLNKIAVDCAGCAIQHVKLDADGRFSEVMKSGLNSCLTIEANKDQTGRAFIQDAVHTMLQEGHVAIVPVDTSIDPRKSDSYEIRSMRTGKVIEWHPDYVKIDVYNDRTGQRQNIYMPKKTVAIVQNPFFVIMNEPNSTFARLTRKLSLLDVVDEQSGSGKLDIIIQLPYAVKNEARKQQAEIRRKDIETQLSSSKYGIAYTDSTEKITQLNRTLENNLMGQVEYLQKLFYSQLGITESLLSGSATELEMLNYNNRVIEPIISAFADEMKRKYLTKTARSQNQSIIYFRDPFKLVPVAEIAKIADTFTRNEIMTSNEIRQKVGLKPVNTPEADELRNKNLNPPGGVPQEGTIEYEPGYGPEDFE